MTLSKPADIRVKRVYDPPDKADGTRVLVDRLWPRGLSKEKAAVTLWLKEIAPSPALRKWFGHDPARWTEFTRRYRAEPCGRPVQRDVRVKNVSGLAVGENPLARRGRKHAAAPDRLGRRGVPRVDVVKIGLNERRADILGLRPGKQRPDLRPGAVSADEKAAGYSRSVSLALLPQTAHFCTLEMGLIDRSIDCSVKRCRPVIGQPMREASILSSLACLRGPTLRVRTRRTQELQLLADSARSRQSKKRNSTRDREAKQ